MKLKNKLELDSTLKVGALPTASTSNYSVLFENGGLVSKRAVGDIINKNTTDFIQGISNSFPSIFNYNTSTTPSDSNLVVSFKNQLAGTVFAAPTTLNGTPSFRKLIDSDLSETSIFSQLGNYVTLDTDQEVTGSKTFSALDTYIGTEKAHIHYKFEETPSEASMRIYSKYGANNNDMTRMLYEAYPDGVGFMAHFYNNGVISRSPFTLYSRRVGLSQFTLRTGTDAEVFKMSGDTTTTTNWFFQMPNANMKFAVGHLSNNAAFNIEDVKAVFRGSVYSYSNMFANGFKKHDSSNDHVLLGQGGHKLISDFALATDIPDVSGFVPNTRIITAGNGLSGGGNLTANRTIALGTPSPIGLSTTNSVTSTSHTHALDSDTITEINKGQLALTNIGTLNSLTTTDKSNLVNAINEVNRNNRTYYTFYPNGLTSSGLPFKDENGDDFSTTSNTGRIYDIRLSTKATANSTGARYVLYNDGSAWHVEEITPYFSSNFQARLRINSSGLPEIFSNQTNTAYGAHANVTVYRTDPGKGAEWKRFISLDYNHLFNLPTIPTASDYITTNTTQTGLSGNKTTSGVWTFNSQINTANHGNSSQWKQAYDWGNFAELKQVSNLDTVTDSGIYRQEMPAGGYNYTATLNLKGGDTRTQLSIARNGNGMKFRGSQSGISSGTWSVWNEVWHTGNFNPAQYVLQSALNTQLANYVPINGVTTINNTKTFTSSPIVPTATLNGHAVNLGQLNTILSDYATEDWVNQQGFVNQTNTIAFNTATVNPTNSYNGLDADTVLNSSRVFYALGTNVPNAAGFLDTTVFSNGAFQMSQGDNDNFYYRRRFGGVWRSWNQVASREWVNQQGFSTQTLTAGTNINIVGNVISATNTTYSAGTLALLQAGTNTSNRVWSPKILADGVIRKGVNNVNPEGQPFSIHANYGSLVWNGNGFSFVADSEQEFKYIEDEQAIGVNPFQDYGFYLSGQRLRFTSAGVSSELLPSNGVSKSKLPVTGSTQRTLVVGATMGGSTYYANDNGLIDLPSSDGILSYSSANGIIVTDWNSFALSEYAMSLGYGSVTSGNYATSVGGLLSTTGFGSTNQGYSNSITKALGYAVGAYNSVRATLSGVFGIGLVNRNDGAFIVGRYNSELPIVPYDTTSPHTQAVFAIGAGRDDTDRYTALTVYGDGRADYAHGYNDSTWTNNTLVTKKWVLDNVGGSSGGGVGYRNVDSSATFNLSSEYGGSASENVYHIMTSGTVTFIGGNAVYVEGYKITIMTYSVGAYVVLDGSQGVKFIGSSGNQISYLDKPNRSVTFIYDKDYESFRVYHVSELLV